MMANYKKNEPVSSYKQIWGIYTDKGELIETCRNIETCKNLLPKLKKVYYCELVIKRLTE